MAAVVEGVGARVGAGAAQGRGLGTARLRGGRRTADRRRTSATTSPRSPTLPTCRRRAASSGSVGLDPFGVGAIVDALAEVGIAGNDRVVGITQGWKLTGAIKTAERKLADGTLVHGGLGLMAWAVGNAKVEPKGNAIVITKQASGTAKIDPLMAAFNAVALMAITPSLSAGPICGRARCSFFRGKHDEAARRRRAHNRRCGAGLVRDLAGLCGVGLVSYGAWMIYPPAGSSPRACC